MDEAAVRDITRPHPNLLTLYFLQALATLIGFPLVFLPLFFKYKTLRYRFDDEGISASWGIFFKREIYLTYRRIQDIHVSRNIVERWLNIGKVEIQTASGSSSAELSIEGMENFGAVRDFLYRKMRGTGATSHAGDDSKQEQVTPATGQQDEVIALLRAIKDDVDGVRHALEAGREGE